MSTDVRLFTTEYIHTINLSGAVVSLLMFLPFLIPVKWEKFNYFSRRLHSPLRVLIRCCTVALLLIIVLLTFPDYPNVPHWVFLSQGVVLALEVWYDPICYFFYWLSLYWVNIGLVFILRSSLTPRAMRKCAGRSLLVAVFFAMISSVGFLTNYEQVRSGIMNTVDIVCVGLIILGYSYLLLENRARHSFGWFVGYKLVWNCLEMGGKGCNSRSDIVLSRIFLSAVTSACTSIGLKMVDRGKPTRCKFIASNLGNPRQA